MAVRSAPSTPAPASTPASMAVYIAKSIEAAPVHLRNAVSEKAQQIVVQARDNGTLATTDWSKEPLIT